MCCACKGTRSPQLKFRPGYCNVAMGYICSRGQQAPSLLWWRPIIIFPTIFQYPAENSVGRSPSGSTPNYQTWKPTRNELAVVFSWYFFILIIRYQRQRQRLYSIRRYYVGARHPPKTQIVTYTLSMRRIIVGSIGHGHAMFKGHGNIQMIDNWLFKREEKTIDYYST